MDAWTWIGLTLGLLCSVAVWAGLIYWINRAKRAEAEQKKLRDELREVASLLAHYHSSYSGHTKEVLGEITRRLSSSSPRFAGILEP
jgi:hypothetical protein